MSSLPPKGWNFDSMYSQEMGRLAAETGVWIQFKVNEYKLTLNSPQIPTPPSNVVKGQSKRKPVRDYLLRQGDSPTLVTMR